METGAWPGTHKHVTEYVQQYVHGCMQKEHGVGRHTWKCGHTWREAAPVDAEQVPKRLEHPQERPEGTRLSQEEKGHGSPIPAPTASLRHISQGVEHGGTVDKGGH